MTPTEQRKGHVRHYAEMLKLDAAALYCAAVAAERVSEPEIPFEHAVALAAAVMRAAADPRAPLGDVGQLRTLATEVRNTPLAMLCGRAIRGDDEAHRRVTVILAGDPDPGTGYRYPVGDCARCRKVAVMVAALASDPGRQVCADCHERFDVATVSLPALADDRPVYGITRGDLVRLAGREVSDAEAAEVAKGLGRLEAVTDVVLAACGSPSGNA